MSKTARPAHQGTAQQDLVSKTDPPAHQGTVQQASVSQTAHPAHQGTAPQPLVSQTAHPAHEGAAQHALVSKTARPAHQGAVPQPLVSKTARPAHEGAYSLSQTYPSAGRCPSDVVAAGSSWKIFSIRPLLGRSHGGVAALEAGDVGFPLCLAGQGGETGVVLDEIEVIGGVHDHEDPAFKAIDLHVKDADGTDTLLNLRPNVPVSLDVALNHLAVPNQLKCLTISFHFLRS